MSSISVEELFEENQKLVYFVLNKYFDWLSHDEDIIQEGNLGLWKAASSWDSSKSKFSTYAVICILNQIKMELRKRSRLHLEDQVSLSTPVNSEGSEITLGDVLPYPKDYFEDVEFYVNFNKMFESLSDKDKKILYLLSQGHTQTEIANVLGCTKSNIFRIKQKILKKLKTTK